MKSLEDFGELKPAEQKLLTACVSGEQAVISEIRPTEPTDDNTVRAEFIRFMALGGDAQHPLHAHGVQLQGAWIIGVLDLEGTTISADLFLECCNLQKTPKMLGLHLRGSLNLQGSKTPGLTIERASIAGSVFLRNGFESTDLILLLSTKIKGDLDCSKAKLLVPERQWTLIADRAQIKGSVFLRNGFESTGKIKLTSASIIGGLYLLDLKTPLKNLDLSNTTVGFLHSYSNAWGINIDLDGFVYDTLYEANWSLTDYLAWLQKQRAEYYGIREYSHSFTPQPWQQLISVLRKMGHKHEANEIAIAFEQRLRDIGKIKGLARPFHWIFGALAGYGYKSMRLVTVMISVWIGCGLFYDYAALQGSFTPSDPLVFQHPTYENCRPTTESTGPRALCACESRPFGWSRGLARTLGWGCGAAGSSP
jgi:hypothetical protein